MPPALFGLIRDVTLTRSYSGRSAADPFRGGPVEAEVVVTVGRGNAFHVSINANSNVGLV
jgi:hypothetical protein